MAMIDPPVEAPVVPGVERSLRRLVMASAGCAVLAIVTIGWATATRNHAFVAFVVWVGFTVAAVATGIVALVRLPRDRSRRPLRRVAVLGVVGGVLCATLGLAIYSASRSDDCPRDRECTIPAPGPGQVNQQP